MRRAGSILGCINRPRPPFFVKNLTKLPNIMIGNDVEKKLYNRYPHIGSMFIEDDKTRVIEFGNYVLEMFENGPVIRKQGIDFVNDGEVILDAGSFATTGVVYNGKGDPIDLSGQVGRNKISAKLKRSLR
jgi:hypothetical protein